MEFGYEERSKKLIERLDRIQNYLQSLPPLPKIGSVSRTEDQSRDLNETRVHSAGSKAGSESAGSAGSSTTKLSVSTRLSKAVPKDERASELLQQSPSASSSPSTSKTSAGGPSPARSNPELTMVKKKKKKRRKENRVLDPLKPTTRTSFGLDIGQGINVINYIKQNAVLGSDAKNKCLAGIITKGTASGVNSDKSLERMQKQGATTGEASGTSIQLKNKETAGPKYKPSGGHKQGFGLTLPVSQSPYSTDSDIYRVRYQERAIELPHHHGLDALQELFVPYMEHDSYPEMNRNVSDNE